MQAASRRGYTSLVNIARKSSVLIPVSRQILASMPRRQAVRTAAVARHDPVASFHTTAKTAAAEATAEKPKNGEEDGLITQFEDLGKQGLIYQTVVDNITRGMELHTMTPVQSQTITEAVQGVDTLAVARTGTGKTVAFLLPVIQRILADTPALQSRGRKATIDIHSIIISPTRELAEQIAKEATRMVANTGIKIGLAVGGTGRIASLREMSRYGCHILVGTPGRLHDLLSDQASTIKAPALNSFVLDEADRLLDDGFGPAIEQIYKLLPSKLEVDRQTLMFSATMEPEVMQMVSRFMKKDYRTVRTVAANETQTHERVPQYGVMSRGIENNIPALFELFKRESMAVENFKAIVFFNTSAEATLTNRLYETSSLSKRIGIRGSVMHSRLTQGARTRTSNNFRNASKAIMFSSDVAARGMDFPNVTHVIQIGVPKDRDTYIHRIGRTGRAGKTGQGWLFLSEWDVQDYVRKLRKIPITQDESLACATVDMSENSSMPNATAEILTDVIQSARAVDFDTKSAAYRACLSLGTGMDKATLIEALNRWSKYGWGLDPPPAISARLAGKLGYSRIPAMNLGNDPRSTRKPDQDNGDGASRSAGGRGSYGERSGLSRYGSRIGGQGGGRLPRNEAYGGSRSSRDGGYGKDRPISRSPFKQRDRVES